MEQKCGFQTFITYAFKLKSRRWDEIEKNPSEMLPLLKGAFFPCAFGLDFFQPNFH